MKLNERQTLARRRIGKIPNGYCLYTLLGAFKINEKFNSKRVN